MADGFQHISCRIKGENPWTRDFNVRKRLENYYLLPLIMKIKNERVKNSNQLSFF